MPEPRRLLEPELHEELVNVYLRIQRQHEEDGKISKDSGTVISRYRRVWETLGAIHLGMLIASITLLFNFFIFNFFLHLTLA